MKKLLLWITSLSLMLSMFSIPAFAAAPKLSTDETNIIKAYQNAFETGDAHYLDKYKYPGVTFNFDKNEKGENYKVLNPQYSKVYDSKAKLNKLVIKGLLLYTDGEALAVGKMVAGMYIKTKSKKVYAFKEDDENSDFSLLSIEDLTDSEKASVEKYLTSLYGKDKANELMYPEEEESDDEGVIDDSDNTAAE